MLYMIMITFKASKAKEQGIKRRAFSLNKEEYIISNKRVPLQKKKKKKKKKKMKKKKKKKKQTNKQTTREILNAKSWT